MHLRILKEKLLLYHHIMILPTSSLAHQVLLQQESLHLPSLKDEVKMFLQKHDVYDLSLFSKQSWKVFVRVKIRELAREYLLEEMKQYKKVDVSSLCLEEFQMKEYFKTMNLSSSRINFRRRSLTMTSCRMSYRNEQRNISEAFVCIGCRSKIDQLSHWTVCPSYLQFLPKKATELNDTELCHFYEKIINHRRDHEM